MANFKIRLQPELKEWLSMRARKNLRSMNSEVLKLLQDAMNKEEEETAFADQ